MVRMTYARSQGSYLGWPVEALKARMLKPVMLALDPWAARNTLLRGNCQFLGVQVGSGRGILP